MKHFFHFIGFIILTVAAATALGFAVMLLWNWLLPDLCGFATIGFWQALGLFALCKLLIGGLGFHGHGHHFHKKREEKMNRFREMHDKWQTMSPEDRRNFIKHRKAFFGAHCCGTQTSEKQDESSN
jgi:hypothetical protein